MGAACTSSHNGHGEHDLNFTVEHVAAVPLCDEHVAAFPQAQQVGGLTKVPVCQKDTLEINPQLLNFAMEHVAAVPQAQKDHDLDVSIASDSTDLGDELEASLATASVTLDNGEYTNVMHWTDGVSHRDGLKDGKMHGYGVWTSADQRTSYAAGEVLDDEQFLEHAGTRARNLMRLERDRELRGSQARHQAIKRTSYAAGDVLDDEQFRCWLRGGESQWVGGVTSPPRGE